MDKILRSAKRARRELADQAAEWLIRLEAATPEEKRAFVKWLKGSKDAPDEILLAKSTDIMLRQLLREQPIDLDSYTSSENNVVDLDGSQDPVSQDGPGSEAAYFESPRRGARSALASSAKWILATSVGLAAAITLVIFGPVFLRDAVNPNLYSTSVGEQRSIELVDGSAVAINAKSRLRVSYSKATRDIYLDAGQALFTVAKDAARPFRVHVGSSVVQAVGTKFDVRRSADRVSVAVVEGTVQVTSEVAHLSSEAAQVALQEAIRVTAGESVNVLATGITPPAPVDVMDVGVWQQRRLVFRDNTLAEITDEFARFNRTPHLRVEGEALRARRLSGVFDADAPEALLTYLAADQTISFKRSGDEIVIALRPLTVRSDQVPQ